MLFLLFCYTQCVHVIGHWRIDLQYSTSDIDDFVSLGSITMDRTFDNNYTAHFQSSVNPSKWQNDLLQAAKNGWIYRVRADSDKEVVQGYNEPCLMLQTNGAHHFRLLLDPDHQNLQSLAVFPENLYSVGTNYHSCETELFVKDSKINGSVVVNTINELPLPDTVSYIQKMEKERQARQHGAQQDNRSFIQKYWMYIAAALIFMVISNATAAEQNGE
uniref:ER membrane protein complex subunit 10 n=1 Tax=Onchocerca volvulus TaxID=6282 RepID=A0A8R1TQQ9_ONCVO